MKLIPYILAGILSFLLCGCAEMLPVLDAAARGYTDYRRSTPYPVYPSYHQAEVAQPVFYP